MSTHESTQQLITNIEKRDRRFRTAQGTFMFLLFASLVAIIFFQYQTLQNVQSDLDKQQVIIDTIKTSNKDSLDTINRHLDCIVLYFGQANRANLTIQDINKCTLQKTGDGIQSFFTQPLPTQGQNKVSSTVPTQTKQKHKK